MTQKKSELRPRVIAVVQARMGSLRLPGKVLRTIDGTALIDLLLDRLIGAKLLDDIVVATSDQPADDKLAVHLMNRKTHVFRGSEMDVMARYMGAAKEYAATIIVRITGDCPLVDPALVDHCVASFVAGKVDYLSNSRSPTYPDGLDVEVFSFAALSKAFAETDNSYDREHVTPYLYNSDKYSVLDVKNEIDYSHLRFTVDEADDLNLIEAIYKYFSPDRNFSWSEAAEYVCGEPDVRDLNSATIRNEGANMGGGQKLWKRAKHIIPGGNMLLSKRPEMFLPEQWPAYFESAKGCEVIDLDAKTYIDMSIMGVGTNVLGYGHDEVDTAVLEVVKKGNMSTLNCPEEVRLAERLIDLNSWADMVRFARSGGEANSIAIRIARAASGRDNVAMCGYHGWHDWYLSANLGDDDNLAGHLLPGLSPAGVPQSLKSSTYPFKYNDFQSLVDLVNNQNIGVIKMEVMRNVEPEDDFLKKVRKLADDNAIVLVFDECTSGFRETFGGLYQKYDVEPDMAVYGKTLGNGYAITAVAGKRSVMEAAQSTFISSTFWTERIGPAAALKTLEIMEREKSWEIITATGLEIRKRLDALAQHHGLSISHAGLPSITSYAFAGDNAMAYKTLISQEMLKKGFLASTAIYVSIAHSKDIIDRYFENLDSVYALISECEEGRDVMSLLEGPICHSGFKRLN